MARAGVAHLARGEVDQAERRGRAHRVGHARREAGQAVEQRPRLGVLAGEDAERPPHLPHDGRRVGAAADHVADAQQHSPAGDRDRVVPVAADAAGLVARDVAAGQAAALERRQLGRQQRLLQGLGDVALALVEGRVVEGEARAATDLDGQVAVLLGEPPPRLAAQQRERADRAAARRHRDAQVGDRRQLAQPRDEVLVAERLAPLPLVEPGDQHRLARADDVRRAAAQGQRLVAGVGGPDEVLLRRVGVAVGHQRRPALLVDDAHRAEVGQPRHHRPHQGVEALVQADRRVQRQAHVGQQAGAVLGALGRLAGLLLGLVQARPLQRRRALGRQRERVLALLAGDAALVLGEAERHRAGQAAVQDQRQAGGDAAEPPAPSREALRPVLGRLEPEGPPGLAAPRPAAGARRPAGACPPRARPAGSRWRPAPAPPRPRAASARPRWRRGPPSPRSRSGGRPPPRRGSPPARRSSAAGARCGCGPRPRRRRGAPARAPGRTGSPPSPPGRARAPARRGRPRTRPSGRPGCRPGRSAAAARRRRRGPRTGPPRPGTPPSRSRGRRSTSAGPRPGTASGRAARRAGPGGGSWPPRGRCRRPRPA